MSVDNNIIFSRRHEDLKIKDDNWKLIYNSYIGGVAFAKGNYLIRYPKESLKSFEARKSRAVYFNQVSPIVDMLSGLLFLNKPTRSIPKELDYLRTNFSKDKSIDEFMRLVSAYSFMFTSGVLVDSPDYDKELFKTKKDRKDNNINPYATLYLPFKIVDFSINQGDGQLNWVLLDNSYYENEDPLSSGKYITKRTLWTRTYWQDFEREGKSGAIFTGPQNLHNVGYVPFKLVSWRDDNNDFVAETVCEDIAMISKLIYNNMSYMDEMLASGTFKMLVYPTKNGQVPVELSSGGVGPLSVIPYDGNFSTQPYFIGASLTEIDPFIKAITFYMAEVLKKVGLSTDETKEFVKSGAAKKIDFQKMRSLLVSGALTMSKTEEWIIKTVAAWDGSSSEGVKSEYTSAFSDEDLETEVTMLTELMVQPVKKLRINVLNILTKKLLTNYLDSDTLESIYKDIEKSIGGGQPLKKNPEEKNPNGFKANIEEAAKTIKQNEEQVNVEG